MSEREGSFSPSAFSRLLRDYGMLIVLVVLCVLFSALTVNEQHPTGREAARRITPRILEARPAGTAVLIVGRDSDEERQFAAALEADLRARGVADVYQIRGDPAEIRSALLSWGAPGKHAGLLVTTESFSPFLRTIRDRALGLGEVEVLTPLPYQWPTFLLPENVRNVANQIAVIAIIAIGMTMVIITAGIDLSVGSLVALSAVIIAWLIERLGAQHAPTMAVVAAGLVAMLLCGATGAFSGLMITRFRIPPFIATLAMMQIAAGLAYIISQGKPIYRLPEGFELLGRGAEPAFKIPYAVLLMLGLYIVAHILMTRTTTGRYIYAVGGNMEAARLAGIRVPSILLFVYTLSGILAGLGGIIMASQLKSGAPTYGLTYELYVIAAVVVGGTSLSGGEGRILGTLIGAFIIAVIQNGMNLTNVESYTQKVVLGAVILGAVLLDRMKQQGFRLRRPG
jgi:ribose transport system permease protein